MITIKVQSDFDTYPTATIYFVYKKKLLGKPKNTSHIQILETLLSSPQEKKGNTLFGRGEKQELLAYILLTHEKQFVGTWLRKKTAEVVRAIRQDAARIISVALFEKRLIASAQEIVLGLYLGGYVFNKFKSKDVKRRGDEEILLITDSINDLTHKKDYAERLAQAVYLARDLVNEPASHVHPETMVSIAKSIASESKGTIDVEIFGVDECRKRGMGAFLGVAQGSERNAYFIVLSWHNKHIKTGKALGLIGKSITFDSGGLSLKPGDSMMDMKIDMAGGAAVLGAFSFLTTHKGTSPFKTIYGIMPACENMPSGRAMKPGDVVTACDGQTIEVLNTDAEGRLALADAIAYAQRELKVDVVVDLATLTGACMVALGNELSGAFFNDASLKKSIMESAVKAGEELWELPLYERYNSKLDSHIADMKNIGGGRYGGAITAALFLKRFVTKPWCHIDIAGPAHNDASSYNEITKGGTGVGVLTIIEFITQSSV